MSPMRVRFLGPALAVLVLSCGPGLPPPASGPPPASATPVAPPAARPPVVVTIAVDQLAAWVLAERLPLLPEAGGFARLRKEGTYVVEARHAHAATDTAPGHAALYTGGPPRHSGIFANEVIDPRSHKRVSILRDPSTRLLGPAGPLDAPGSSTAAYRAETLADRLRAEHPDAFVASFALKDRSAIPGGGRKPDAVIWYDTGSDAFVTSTAFAPAFPAWAAAEGAHEAVERQRAAPWALLRPAWVASNARTPDLQPGEGDVGGFGVVFPHGYSASSARPMAFRASPASDERLLALALAAVARPRFGAVPSLLAISFSANDYVGHVFGPDSWEAWDQLSRLDVMLSTLLDALDRRVGSGNYAVLLSADHGTTPMPETASVAGARPWCGAPGADRWERPCAAGGRLYMDELSAALQAAARAAIGPGDWVLGVADPYVYLTPEARSLDAARRDKLLAALVATLSANPLVARVVETRTIPATCAAPLPSPPRQPEPLDTLLCRSLSQGAGELYVVARSGSFFDPDYIVGKGTSHGAPYLHDRSVPLLVRAPGRARAGQSVDEPVGIAAFARTAASMLGVAPPSGAADGIDLAPPATR
jgi:hypothetical protein